MELDDLLLIGAVLWIATRKWSDEVVPALQRGGVKVYEKLHDDEGHKRDLPGKGMTRAQIATVARQAGFTENEVPTMVAIAMAESGGVPNAYTKTDREESVGLWQINLKAHSQWSREEMADPAKNAHAAFVLSRSKRGLMHWSVYQNDRYKDFL
jgi:hypothetical protein